MAQTFDFEVYVALDQAAKEKIKGDLGPVRTYEIELRLEPDLPEAVLSLTFHWALGGERVKISPFTELDHAETARGILDMIESLQTYQTAKALTGLLDSLPAYSVQKVAGSVAVPAAEEVEFVDGALVFTLGSPQGTTDKIFMMRNLDKCQAWVLEGKPLTKVLLECAGKQPELITVKDANKIINALHKNLNLVSLPVWRELILRLF